MFTSESKRNTQGTLCTIQQMIEKSILNIDLEKSINLKDLTVLDGGRTSYLCEQHEFQFTIRIVRDCNKYEKFEKGYCPGALYLNNNLVKIKSSIEERIIQILENLIIEQSEYDSKLDFDNYGFNNMGELIKNTIKKHIKFIKSDRYLEIAKLTGRY